MKNKFNLLDEPWLNVRRLDGKAERLGIRDTLARAHELRALEDASPVVLVALYRLLLAILHRAFQGPTGLPQLRRWLGETPFDMSQIETYLSEYAQRFYLFGDEPFYQVGDLDVEPSSVAKLAVERSSGNNKALFDHSVDERPPRLGYDEAARWLVGHQAFSLCGGVSKGGLKNFTDAASPRGAFVMVQGRNLYETLVANLAIYPEDLETSDATLWEQPALTHTQLKKKQQGNISGFASLYTWPSRAVRFIDDGDGVSLMYYASGLQTTAWFQDPMLAYQKPKKAVGDNVEVKFSLDRAFWRDFATLVPPDADLRPEVLRQAEELSSYFDNDIVRVNVLGQIARPGKPTVDAWRSEGFPLPLAALTNEDHRGQISKATEIASDVADALRTAGYVMATELADRERAADIRDSLPLLNPYWADLERHFTTFLTDLAQSTNAEDAYLTWRDTVTATAWKAFNLAASSVKGSGGAVARKATLAGENVFYRELRKLKLLEEVKA